jgi:hypothetical protein
VVTSGSASGITHTVSAIEKMIRSANDFVSPLFNR